MNLAYPDRKIEAWRQLSLGIFRSLDVDEAPIDEGK